MKHNIRLAAAVDSESILSIYKPYITDTAITFELEVPSIDEFSERILAIGKQYPFIVYEVDGVIAGYAYACRHMERAAYQYDVDVSIYVSQEFHGTGIAKKLYACLFALLRKLGYKNVYALLTSSNTKSIKFHEKFDFTLIGTHHKTGYKFGQWHDVTWFEKTINDYEQPPKLMGINEMSSESLQRLLDFYAKE